jgi:hypothetical protein
MQESIPAHQRQLARGGALTAELYRDSLEDNRKYGDVFDEHQIVQWARIDDYDDHPD